MTGNIKDKGKRGSPLERFWRYVSPGDPYECWLWQGKLAGKGYGSFGHSKNITMAHVASWVLFRGPTNGLCVLHYCDNPSCVNPNHLWLGTHKDNARDMVQKKRHHYQTNPERVPRGHLHTNANLTPRQIRDVRFRYACGETQKALALRFGVSRTAIWNIVQGLTYTNVAFETSKDDEAVTRFPTAHE